MKKFKSSQVFAKELDKKDSLNNIKKEFYHPKNNSIYLCGHSLGLQPKSTNKYVKEVLNSWSTLGVQGHIKGNFPWFDYHKYLTKKMSKIVGSKQSETVVMNSLTTNLHLLMISFYRPTNKKYNIIIDNPSFPSDKYAVQSHLKLHGLDPNINLIEINTYKNNQCLNNDEILFELEKKLSCAALILFSGVNYYTGQYYDIESIAKLANKYNCVIGLDLAHAAGNVKLNLNKWNIDFASWCGYKYLNGGPGAPSGAFIHSKHHGKKLKRLEGWWGHNRKTRFNPPKFFNPIKGAEGWQLSNPPILSMAALRSSLDLFDKVGMNDLYIKSKNLTSYLEFLIHSQCKKNIKIITPNNSNSRGAQFSLIIKSNVNNIENYFKSKNIICDFRKPNVLRISLNPFYNSYTDIYNFVNYVKKL